MTIRKLIFWLHLIAGIAAGIVILIMSATGVLLTYEKQIVAWADRRYLTEAPTHGAPRVPAGMLVSAIRLAGGGDPTTLTFYAESAVASGAVDGATYYVDSHTGEFLGKGSTTTRAFFRTVTDWHRYLAMSGDNRASGRAITDATNLLFLFIVSSGAVIWWRGAVTWFKKGLRGKALFWNWHNVFGVWAVVPLFLIVLSGVVMSYSWANGLVYTLTGSEQPAQGGGRRGGGRGGRESAEQRTRQRRRFDGHGSGASHGRATGSRMENNRCTSAVNP